MDWCTHWGQEVLKQVFSPFLCKPMDRHRKAASIDKLDPRNNVHISHVAMKMGITETIQVAFLPLCH